MDAIIKRPALSIAILACLCLYLFFFQLGGMALTDPDETFYAQSAREMLERGEWATAYIFGKPQFEKPIFFYWLVEASFTAFGVNEFAARLPSAIFALIGVIAIYLLGALLFNRRTGFFAGLILACNVEYIILSRACVTDMVLAVWMLIGMLAFLYARLREKRYAYLVSAAGFGLATLTKGPVAILLAGVIIVVYLSLARDLKSILRMPLAGMAVVFLAVVAPWYLLAYKLHGREFIDAFFGFQNVTRFLEAEHKMGSQWYYNIPIALGGFFPWSAFLPFGLWRIFKKAFSFQLSAFSKNNHALFLLVWFAVIFIFFSISSTKLPTYIFPCFMPLALIVAVLWDEFLDKAAARGVVRGMKISYYLLTIIVVLGLAGALVFLYFDFPAVLGGVAMSGLFLLFGICLASVAFKNSKYFSAALLIVYSVMVFLYPFKVMVLPHIERHETSKEVSAYLLKVMKPGERLGAESKYMEGLAFYTGRIPVDVDRHEEMVRLFESKDRIWCVLKEKNHAQLYDLDSKPYCMKDSYMVYKVDKRAVATNLIPEDGVYLVKRQRRM